MFIPQQNTGVLVIPTKYIFTNNTARNDYFVANPSELTDKRQVYITGSETLQQYELASVSWIDISPTIRGTSGAKGDTGAAGAPGVFPTIHTLTEKVTPVNNDVFVIEDSESSYGYKKVKFSAIGSGGGGLPTDIDDPVNGQILYYDESTAKWKNLTPIWLENEPVNVEVGQIATYYNSGAVTNSGILVDETSVSFDRFYST